MGFISLFKLKVRPIVAESADSGKNETEIWPVNRCISNGWPCYYFSSKPPTVFTIPLQSGKKANSIVHVFGSFSFCFHCCHLWRLFYGYLKSDLNVQNFDNNLHYSWFIFCSTHLFSTITASPFQHHQPFFFYVYFFMSFMFLFIYLLVFHRPPTTTCHNPNPQSTGLNFKWNLT